MPPSSQQSLGQWFTPPAVAELVLSLACEGRERCSVLDPTCGDGVFLEAASRRGLHARGIDIDPDAAAVARARVPEAEIEVASLFDVDPDRWLSDVVVGNPPYVRHERLAREYRDNGRRCIGTDWGSGTHLDELGKRADLAALCIPRMLKMVRPGGRLGLVISSALFDAAYARALWRGILELASIVTIASAPDERWFAEAAVNAVVVVLERGGAPRSFPVVRLTTPVTEARVRSVDELLQGSDVRFADPTAPEQWPSLLRAPAQWFDFTDCAGGSLVPLKEVASVRRGMTSGANEVFYLSRQRASELEIESEVLAPLLRSPRQSGGESIEFDDASAPWLALTLEPLGDAPKRFPRAFRYLEAHEHIRERPTIAARDPWWSLRPRRAQVFLTKSYSERFVQRFCRRPVVADQRVYTVEPRHGVSTMMLAAVLNSSFTALALESLGRASLGEGALEWTVADAKSLPIVDPRRLDSTARDATTRALTLLAARPQRSVREEVDCHDRMELDRAVAGGQRTLAASARDVRLALARAVQRRVRRASTLATS